MVDTMLRHIVETAITVAITSMKMDTIKDRHLPETTDITPLIWKLPRYMEDLRRNISMMPSCARDDGRVTTAMLQHLSATRRRALTRKLVPANILNDTDVTRILPEVRYHNMIDHSNSRCSSSTNNNSSSFLRKHLHKMFLERRLMLVWELFFLQVKKT